MFSSRTSTLRKPVPKGRLQAAEARCFLLRLSVCVPFLYSNTGLSMTLLFPAPGLDERGRVLMVDLMKIEDPFFPPRDQLIWTN